MIHFVYAGIPETQEISSPSSITKHLYKFLRTKAEVQYHNWLNTYEIDLGPGDILIGHPHPHEKTVVRRTFKSSTNGMKYLLFPFHHNIPSNLVFDKVVDQCDRLFAITGTYWYNTIEYTPFAHWKDKIVRVDMAVDHKDFPRVKESFNEIGSRGILYIGRDIPEKNIALLKQIIDLMPNVEFTIVGNVDIQGQNVKCLGKQKLDKVKARELCRQNDIFINTSISDANPTTILEAASWGLIPVCTKQSGYTESDLVYNIDLNPEGAVKKLSHLLNLDNDVLIERSLRLSQLIYDEYNWDKFCETVWYEISKDSAVG